MTQKQLDTEIFIVTPSLHIEAMDYQEYLDLYGVERACTPDGVCRTIRVEEEEDGYVVEEFSGQKWRKISEYFDTENEANMTYYSILEFHAQNQCDAPSYYYTEAEAIEQMADVLGKPVRVVIRFVSISRIRQERQEEARAIAVAAAEKRKAEKLKLAEMEAAKIIITPVFIASVKEAFTKSKKEKFVLLQAAMGNLLNGATIASDYWVAMRLLVARAKAS